MALKSSLKILARSGSTRFLRDYKAQPDGTVASYNFNGKPIHYRVGTSDPNLIYAILLKGMAKSEYHFPKSLEPRLIFDIGGNIGVTSIRLANAFPSAKIHVFEPMADNFALLAKNVAPYGNVTPHHCGLDKTDGSRDIIFSPDTGNFGGFSFFQRGANDETPRVTITTRSPKSMLAEIGADHVDLIKIDTEGAEFDILTAFPEDVLAKTQWIVGELHGERDFELLEWLSKWFDIGIKRTIGKPLFLFNACNRQQVATLGREFNRHEVK